MRIVVTGAAGFIASNLIPRLLDAGHEVLGIDDFFLGKRAYVARLSGRAAFRFVEQDLLDREAVHKLFEGFRPARVWHLAANSDISYGTKYTDFDLKGGTLVTYNVLEAMRLCGTHEIVFSSSGAIYGEPTVHPTPEDYGPLFPISLYAASKLACEGLITAYAHNYEMKSWIYRFGNIVGPYPTHGVIHDFVLRLNEDPSKLRILGDGSQAKPYVHVDDCLDGMELGIERAPGGEVSCFNLAVADQTTVLEIADGVMRAMGLDPARVPREMTGGNRGWRGDVPFVNLDSSRIRALGWKPKHTSGQAVERSITEAIAALLGK
jgi:UDP-glucose 4-epimerase